MAEEPTSAVDFDSSDHRMQVTRVERVSALLLTGVLFVGLFTGMLLTLWLLSSKTLPLPHISVAAIAEQPPGGEAKAPGTEHDFDSPAEDEVEQLLEPTLQNTLTAVTDAVTTVAASMEVAATGPSTVVGDRRRSQSNSDSDVVPPFERWKLKFISKDLTTYARQLDFFQVELGVVGGGVPGVDYARDFSGQVTTRHGASEAERRLYFRWTDEGVLKQFDRHLLERAGVPAANRLTMMFLPEELVNQLAMLEAEVYRKAGKPDVRHVAKTVFEVQPDGRDFMIQVIDQRYRTP